MHRGVSCRLDLASPTYQQVSKLKHWNHVSYLNQDKPYAGDMSSMRTILTSTALVGAVGIGYGMWSIISPSEERKREILKVRDVAVGYSCENLQSYLMCHFLLSCWCCTWIEESILLRDTCRLAVHCFSERSVNVQLGSSFVLEWAGDILWVTVFNANCLVCLPTRLK